MQKEIQLHEPFTKVRCKDIGTLILTQGDQISLIAEADQALLSQLIAEVRGDSLVLGLEEDWFGQMGKVLSSIFNDTDRKVIYHLTVPDLDQIRISGKMDLDCESFTTDDFKLKVSGLGKLNFNHLDCNALETIISGRGEFSASGRAGHQTIRISGSGDYNAPQLSSQTIRIVISGQGNATLRVEESLEITISGLGQVNYIGRPKLRQVITGLGKSKRLNDQ
jgi:hypothetical protein